jgi:hypothetical protein
MPAQLRNVRAALLQDPTQEEVPRWGDVRNELAAATSSPLTAEVERLLLSVLAFRGRLRLDETSPMPHRMSPENMLKSLAVQALARWTGAKFLPTMKRLLATAAPSLACMIRGEIQKVSAGRGAREQPEVVEELIPQAATETVLFDFTGPGAAAVVREFGDRVLSHAVPVCQAYGMTLVPVEPAFSNGWKPERLTLSN